MNNDSVNSVSTTQDNPRKKAYKLIAALIVLLILALGANSLFKKNDGQLVTLDKGLNSESLPAGFPKDFPIDVTAKMVKDGIKDLGESQQQLLFVTNLAIEQSYGLYEQYFDKQGWTVLQKVDDAVIKSLTVKDKEGTVIALTFSPAANNKTQVSGVVEKNN